MTVHVSPPSTIAPQVGGCPSIGKTVTDYYRDIKDQLEVIGAMQLELIASHADLSESKAWHRAMEKRDRIFHKLIAVDALSFDEVMLKLKAAYVTYSATFDITSMDLDAALARWIDDGMLDLDAACALPALHNDLRRLISAGASVNG